MVDIPLDNCIIAYSSLTKALGTDSDWRNIVTQNRLILIDRSLKPRPKVRPIVPDDGPKRISSVL